MSDFRLSDQTRLFQMGGDFALESGESLPGAQIAFRTWGQLSARADNAVIVCHALTGSADADQWWAPLFGKGRALDPSTQFIVCSNVLGGCYGSTGPTTPAPDGQPWGARFPRLTIRDQVRAQIALADALGIRRIRFVIGGSMGGLQALEWALLDPQRVGAVVTIAASAAHSPWCLAWSEVQRLTLAVQGWARHHGDSPIRRFDAHSYRVLLDAMDTHDIGRGRGGCRRALEQIRQPVLVGSVPSDALYAPEDQLALVSQLARASLIAIDSEHGHDGFLIDAGRFEPAIRRFLAEFHSGDVHSLLTTSRTPSHISYIH